jgi:serine/threonine-protein kinase
LHLDERVQYFLAGSQLTHDTVHVERSPGVPEPIDFDATPIVDISTSSKDPTPAQLRRLADGERVEAVLGERYRLRRVLARGGMATVYLARDLREARDVAVKILDFDGGDRWAIRQFAREARLGARIHHPNVVEVFDIGSTCAGVVYMVMERLVGSDLGTIADRRRLSWGWTRHMMTQVCAGVGAIHAAGFVHCDLKPGNCFYVRRSARLKVLDLGIVTPEHRRPDDTSGLVGTPQYMAPEQARGEPIDRRADVYAAGVLVCELMAGRPPFTGSSPREILLEQLHSEPPRLSALAEGLRVPPGLDEIVARALAKDRRDRFSTIGEFADAIARVDLPRARRRGS